MMRVICACAIAAGGLLSWSVAQADFVSTELDISSFVTERILDPAGANTFVGDTLSGLATGVAGAVPVAQWVTIRLSLPEEYRIRVAAGSAYYCELTIGNPDVYAVQYWSINGDLTIAGENPVSAERQLSYSERVINGRTEAFILRSQYFQPGSDFMIRLFTFRFGLPSNVWNQPPVTGEQLKLSVRGSTFVPREEVDDLPHQVQLVRIAPLAGDANRDGRVDGEDFLIWQASFGMQGGAGWDDGDFNGDNRVDGEDFLIWQANFGRSESTSAITPEPGALGLLAVGWLFRRRRG